MVRLHCFDHFLAHAEFLQDAAADFDVCTGDLVIDGLADVMEERSRAGDSLIGAQFRGEHARQVSDFDRVVEHVLAVAGAEVEAAENHDKFGVEIRDFGLERGFGALLLDDVVDFLLGLLH